MRWYHRALTPAPHPTGAPPWTIRTRPSHRRRRPAARASRPARRRRSRAPSRPACANSSRPRSMRPRWSWSSPMSSSPRPRPAAIAGEVGRVAGARRPRARARHLRRLPARHRRVAAGRGVAPRLDRLGRAPRRPVLPLGRDRARPGGVSACRVGGSPRSLVRGRRRRDRRRASSSVSTCSTRPTRPSAMRPQLAVDPGVRPLVVGRARRRLHRPDRRDRRGRRA